ncbi:MAG: hypothetical protein GEV06_16755 [Luteitalea sp.]|nr:hypothetical protein [Luteitalea sp.]
MPDLTKLSAAKLQALYDKRYAAVSANCTALIEAGFGNMRGSEIRAMDHPLAGEHRRVNDSFYEVVAEQDARKRWHGSLKPIKRVA